MGKSHLTKLFQADFSHQLNPLRTIGISVVEEESLQISAEGLFVGDGFDRSSWRKVNTGVPPGIYPVVLSLLQDRTTHRLPDGTIHVSRDDRLAAAKINLSNLPVKSWKVLDLIEPDSLKSSKAFSVDSGRAIIGDWAGLRHLGQDCGDVISSGAAEKPLRMYFPRDLPAAVSVSSGYGDGRYHCYGGFDQDGSITSVVIDFDCFSDKKSPFFDFEFPAGGATLEAPGITFSSVSKWRSQPLADKEWAFRILNDGTSVSGRVHLCVLSDAGDEIDCVREVIDTVDGGKYLTLVRISSDAAPKLIRIYFV